MTPSTAGLDWLAVTTIAVLVVALLALRSWFLGAPAHLRIERVRPRVRPVMADAPPSYGSGGKGGSDRGEGPLLQRSAATRAQTSITLTNRFVH